MLEQSQSNLFDIFSNPTFSDNFNFGNQIKAQSKILTANISYPAFSWCLSKGNQTSNLFDIFSNPTFSDNLKKCI